MDNGQSPQKPKLKDQKQRSVKLQPTESREVLAITGHSKKLVAVSKAGRGGAMREKRPKSPVFMSWGRV